MIFVLKFLKLFKKSVWTCHFNIFGMRTSHSIRFRFSLFRFPPCLPFLSSCYFMFYYYLFFSQTGSVIFSSCVNSQLTAQRMRLSPCRVSGEIERNRGRGGVAESANVFTCCVYMRRAGFYQDICRQSTSAYVSITWKYISLSLFLPYKISLARVVNFSSQDTTFVLGERDMCEFRFIILADKSGMFRLAVIYLEEHIFDC